MSPEKKKKNITKRHVDFHDETHHEWSLFWESFLRRIWGANSKKRSLSPGTSKFRCYVENNPCDWMGWDGVNSLKIPTQKKHASNEKIYETSIKILGSPTRFTVVVVKV